MLCITYAKKLCLRLQYKSIELNFANLYWAKTCEFLVPLNELNNISYQNILIVSQSLRKLSSGAIGILKKYATPIVKSTLFFSG